MPSAALLAEAHAASCLRCSSLHSAGPADFCLGTYMYLLSKSSSDHPSEVPLHHQAPLPVPLLHSMYTLWMISASSLCVDYSTAWCLSSLRAGPLSVLFTVVCCHSEWHLVYSKCSIELDWINSLTELLWASETKGIELKIHHQPLKKNCRKGPVSSKMILQAVEETKCFIFFLVFWYFHKSLQRAKLVMLSFGCICPANELPPPFSRNYHTDP